jgi:electron transport complex protein RnfG
MKRQLNVKGMLKLGLTLAAFAAAVCVMLAFVYAGTEKIIAQRQQADLEAALGEVFPQADSFEPVDGIESASPVIGIESGFAALKGGEITGVVLNFTTQAGYSGPLKILAGINSGGTVTGVKILEHSETPGLGANAESRGYFVDKNRRITFHGQFAGKHASDPFEVHNDVIAITASTITSRAVTGAVQAAALSAGAWFQSNENAGTGARVGSTGGGE